MICNGKALSNDQHLIATIPKVILSHRNSRHRSILHDFRFLFNYINQNAEQPVSLLYNIGILIIDAEHIVFKRIKLARYFSYCNSTFSHFFMRHHFHRISIKSIMQFTEINIFTYEKCWTAYQLDSGSTFSNMLLNFPFLWANNNSVKETIGLPNPVLNLLESFRNSFFREGNTLIIA